MQRDPPVWRDPQHRPGHGGYLSAVIGVGELVGVGRAERRPGCLGLLSVTERKKSYPSLTLPVHDPRTHDSGRD